MNVNVKYLDLPCTIRAMTVKDYDGEDYYTVVLNSRMSRDMHIKSYRHEMEHISSNDFDSQYSADYIESIRHR